MAATVVVTGLLTAPQAGAGGWEETVLDPPPARIEAGVTYEFGYWVLQHGSYPFKGGDLGPTALRATDEKGTVVDFPGVAAPTEGRYLAEVRFPHDGRWTIGSQHGMLMPDELVATVTVPGPVEIAPSMVVTRAPYEWGPIRPHFPPTAPDADLAAPHGPTEEFVPPLVGDVEPRSQVTEQAAPREDPGLPGWLVVAGGVATLGFAWWLTRRHRRVSG